MNLDEMHLRHLLRTWQRRFVDGSSAPISVMIAVKNEYWQKYGFDELKRIVREVEVQVATEMMKGDDNGPSQLQEMSGVGMGMGHGLPEMRSDMASVQKRRKPRWTQAQRLAR